MASVLSNLLAKLGISYKEHAHPEVTGTNKEWQETILASAPPASLGFIKTLLLKPKGGTNSKPILLIALDTTDIAINPIAKSVGSKEARAAADDFIQSTLGVAKNDVNPFVLSNVANKSEIIVLIDEKIFAEGDAKPLAVRSSSSTSSTIIPSGSLKSFLQKELGSEFALTDFSALVASSGSPSTAAPAKSAPEKAKKEESGEASKETKIGLEVKKDEDFPTWYQQVLTRTEMLDYYDISGCYIIRPWAYKIWKEIQGFFGNAIEDIGVEDCYFPMFVSARALNREKDHIEGFAPEVAWVTKAGNSELAEHIAVRPTSETVMYPAYSSWIRSHRDLPLRLNQWCNVVRWEFKHPQPFLRTREFLWQEGHTAFATKEEAEAEVLQILDLYRRVYEELLAVPVVPGRKSEKEKFAGGLFTTTVEGFIPTTGRAIQGATSHCLGQNFAKMFEIMIENENKERAYVWQNSWGLTTRTIGVMVMVHGDDKGLVLPPRVASIQAIVIPVGITSKSTPEERKLLNDKAEELAATLKAAGLRSKADIRENYTPGYKYNHWELRGVPLRLEIGPKDLAKNSTRVIRRDNGEATFISLDGLGKSIGDLLETIQSDMFARAKQERDSRLIRLETWDNFVSSLDKKCMILAPWCETVTCEEGVKERSARSSQDENQDEKAPSMGAKTLCIPFNQPTERPLVPGVTKCFACSNNAKSYTLWGRSY